LDCGRRRVSIVLSHIVMRDAVGRGSLCFL
jgi:hypothetical protein